MKKIILLGSTLLLSLGLANAQTAGTTATSVYDDMGATAYTFWYSSKATAVNGTRGSGKISFAFPTASGQTWLAADFGIDPVTSNPITVDLTGMSDIQFTVKNTGAADWGARVYLKDVNNHILEIEPNVSDCAGVPDFATATPNTFWTSTYMLYPPNSGGVGSAVYPTEGYNGFVLQAGTTQTIRIDLSSVSTAKGGLFTQGVWGSPAKPSNAPLTYLPTSATAGPFDITKVHVVEFTFNENTVFNLSGTSIDHQSYKYDAQLAAQSTWTGGLDFTSMKVGSVLSALPSDITLAVTDAAVNNSLKVYPNPSKDALTVSFESTQGAMISLSELNGFTVYSLETGAGQNSVTVNTSAFKAGVYILNVTTENGTSTRKVSIQ